MKRMVILMFCGCTNIGVVQTAPGAVANVQQTVNQGVNTTTYQDGGTRASNAVSPTPIIPRFYEVGYDPNHP